MTYAELLARLASAMGDDHSTDDGWSDYLPAIIEQAELRCYRDIDPLAVRKTATVTLAPAIASFTAPADWLLGQSVRLIGPNVTLERREYSFLVDYSGTQYGQPKYWTEQPQGTLWVAPVPAISYSAELFYHFRPAALSLSNTTTWLSLNVPDLFFFGCMVAVTGYQKNFGAQADDPRSAMSWDRQYQQALVTALREEARRKGDTPFDRSQSPPPSINLPPGAQQQG